jgi:hypothetical protein
MSRNSLSVYTSQQVATVLPPSGTSLVAVRVKDVILDDKHPEYIKLGKTTSIGAIKYEPIIDSSREENTGELMTAYPLDVHLKVYPLVDEIVLINSTAEKTENDSQTGKKTYYSTIVNTWNLVNHNASPSWYSSNIKLGDNVPELNINPLLPSPGDVLISGRHGQSIRLTGYNHVNNTLFNQDNNGKALTIIRNGQKQENDKEKYINEDINKDDSSIYLTSNHKVPLKQARDKQGSFKVIPTSTTAYQGRQVLIDSGRLILNAKDDDILISSKEGFGISSNFVGIDAAEYISVDAKKIYLGKSAKDFELQPVILGNSLEVFLFSLLNGLSSLADQLIAANANGIPVLNLNQEGAVLKGIIAALEKQINPNGTSMLKSKKVYTE